MIYFRRRLYYTTDPRYAAPRWHVAAIPGVGLATELPAEFGSFVALCGYAQRHVRGRLLISITDQAKPDGSTCSKCARKLTSATPAL